MTLAQIAARNSREYARRIRSRFAEMRVDFEFSRIVLGSPDQTHKTSSRPRGLARSARFCIDSER